MRRSVLAATAMLVLVPLVAWAQRDTVSDTTRAGAPVVVRGDTLFRLVSRLGPFGPAERAQAASRRIDSLASLPRTAQLRLVAVDTAGTTEIRLGDFVIVAVTEADVVASGITRRQAAAAWASDIQATIETGATRANLKTILLGALFTLLTGAGLVLLLWAMGRAFPWVHRKLDSWRGTRIPAIKIQKLEVLSSDRLTDTLIVAAKVIRVVAIVIVLYVFLPLVFSFFPWTRSLSSTLFGWVVAPLKRAGLSFVNYLPDLFSIAVIIAVTYYLLKFIHLFFIGLGRGAITLPGFYRDWAEPTYKIVRFLVIVIVAVMVYPYMPGSDTSAFKGISVFLGILVSFGSASAISNLIAGVVMTYMRPFQIGDRVRIADTIGDVIEKTLLVTRVRTPKHVDTTIPNAMVLSSHIINYNRTAKQAGVILPTSVSIGYGTPWRTVHELLLAAATATASVLDDPKPFVLQTALNDFYVTYELNVYTDNPNDMQQIYSDLHQNIQDRFSEAGVEIMSPHYRAMREGNAPAIPPKT